MSGPIQQKTQGYTCWKQNLPCFSKKQCGVFECVFDLTMTFERSCYNKGLWMRARVVFSLSLNILQAEKQPHSLHNKQMKGTVCGEQAEWIHKAILLTVSLECSLKNILCFCVKNNKSPFAMASIKRFPTGFTWSMVDPSGRSVSRWVHHNIWPQDYS